MKATANEALMMKGRVIAPGSIIEISEEQAAALGKLVTPIAPVEPQTPQKGKKQGGDSTEQDPNTQNQKEGEAQ